MRRFARRWAGCLLAVLAAAAHAAELRPPSPTLRAEGRAAIYHEDLAGARERAVRAALIRGLERYAGLRIEAATLIRKGELIDREVRAHTQGYVRSFEVVDSRRDGGEMVVEVSLTVAEEPVAESFRRLMSATTTLLLVRETNLGRPVDGGILPARLADPFFTTALVVPPPERLAALASQVPEGFYGRPDPETVKELGLRWLAGVILVVRADTRKLDGGAGSLGYAVDPAVLRPVVAADGDLTLLDGRSGRVLASRRFEDVRGSDAACAERAGREALASLAEQMRGFVVERLSAHVRELGHPLRVIARGAAADDGGRRLAQVLESTRWVERVEHVREAPGEAVLQATCRENPYYVVEELRQAPEIRVVRFDAGLGEVEVR
jgi:hypothetical protein